MDTLEPVQNIPDNFHISALLPLLLLTSLFKFPLSHKMAAVGLQFDWNPLSPALTVCFLGLWTHQSHLPQLYYQPLSSCVVLSIPQDTQVAQNSKHQSAHQSTLPNLPR